MVSILTAFNTTSFNVFRFRQKIFDLGNDFFPFLRVESAFSTGDGLGRKEEDIDIAIKEKNQEPKVVATHSSIDDILKPEDVGGLVAIISSSSFNKKIISKKNNILAYLFFSGTLNAVNDNDPRELVYKKIELPSIFPYSRGYEIGGLVFDYSDEREYKPLGQTQPKFQYDDLKPLTYRINPQLSDSRLIRVREKSTAYELPTETYKVEPEIFSFDFSEPRQLEFPEIKPLIYSLPKQGIGQPHIPIITKPRTSSISIFTQSEITIDYIQRPQLFPISKSVQMHSLSEYTQSEINVNALESPIPQPNNILESKTLHDSVVTSSYDFPKILRDSIETLVRLEIRVDYAPRQTSTYPRVLPYTQAPIKLENLSINIPKMSIPSFVNELFPLQKSIRLPSYARDSDLEKEVDIVIPRNYVPKSQKTEPKLEFYREPREDLETQLEQRIPEIDDLVELRRDFEEPIATQYENPIREEANEVREVESIDVVFQTEVEPTVVKYGAQVAVKRTRGYQPREIKIDEIVEVTVQEQYEQVSITDQILNVKTLLVDSIVRSNAGEGLRRKGVNDNENALSKAVQPLKEAGFGSVHVSVYDVSKGSTDDFGGEEETQPACGVKLGIFLAAMYSVSNKEISLNDRIQDDRQLYTAAMGSTKESYALSELLQGMVSNTDPNTNYFGNLVLKHLGYERTEKILDELGAGKTKIRGPFQDGPDLNNEDFINWRFNRTTTNEIAYTTDKLLRGEDIDKESHEFVMNTFLQGQKNWLYGVEGLFLIKNGCDKHNVSQVMFYQSGDARQIIVVAANENVDDLFISTNREFSSGKYNLGTDATKETANRFADTVKSVVEYINTNKNFKKAA